MTQLKIVRDGIRVEWVNLDEGWSGDYNPDDPDDDNLLRFDVHVQNKRFPYKEYGNHGMDRPDSHGWYPPREWSFCTQMPANSPEPLLQEALEHLWKVINNNGPSKSVMEELSWIGPHWFGPAA